jgi:hypothetical protein
VRQKGIEGMVRSAADHHAFEPPDHRVINRACRLDCGLDAATTCGAGVLLAIARDERVMVDK